MVRRWRFPLILVVFATIAWLALRFWPDPDWPNFKRIHFSNATALATILVLCIWFVLDGPLRLRYRLLGLLAMVAAGLLGVLSIRTIEFTGDMAIIPHFRWQRSRDAVLEAARTLQPSPTTKEPIDLRISPEDFPGYRGADRSAVVRHCRLSRDWTAQPPITIWRQPIGGGYAGFAVAGNIVVTIEQRRDNEAVVCYDQDTGRERWFHEYTAHFSESLGGPGPRATPTIFDGAVYSLGASGELVCLDGATGRQIWHVNILADTRAQNLQWGMAGSPLVFDELVVVNPGGSDGGVAAYDRRTGSKVWSAGKHKAGYSSPALATLGGYRQILVFDGAGLAGYDPAGSGELWRYPWSTMQDINVAQPLVLDGERVLISSGYGVGCALLRVRRDADRWSVEPVWPTKVSRAMQCKFTSPIEYEGFIYGLDDGIMVCVDPTSGSRCWKKGRYGHGQILLVGDVILVLTEIGDVALVEADPQQHRESARFHALDGKTWNTPALSGNRLFVRNHREMACYELPALVR